MKEDKRFSFFKEKSFFSHIDIFFANYLKCKDEKEAVFFAYLFLISRHGFVSLLVEKDFIYPMPKDLNLEDGYDIDEKSLIENVLLGAEAYSKRFFSKKINFSFNFPIFPICKFQNYYYLQKNYVLETLVINKLKEFLLEKPKELLSKEIFSELVNKNQSLNLEQKQAILNVLENSISFIIGGPGSGKTYVAAHLIDIFYSSFSFKKKQPKIVATAFTGKATSHLRSKIAFFSKNIEIETKTLHSLLDLKEKRDKALGIDKIFYDLVIIDEASMIDLKLLAYLLDSILKGCRIVFIGDPNQLPSIEAGSIFSEIASQNIFKTTLLKKSIRFSNNIIYKLANALEKSDTLAFTNLLDETESIFIDIDENKNIKKELFKKVKKYFFVSSKEPLLIDTLFEKLNDFRILSSLKKGFFGFDSLNNEIFQLFFKQVKENEYFYVPIIITKNNYKLDLYNGQIGIAQYLISKNRPLACKCFFKIDEGIIDFPLDVLTNFELAYVISIHKSQGSEYNNVMIILPDASCVFGKELLYTAITRAKNNLQLLSTKKIIQEILIRSLIKKSGFLKRFLSCD